MNKYDLILEKLQDQVDRGVISFEDAEKVNMLAFEKYGCHELVEEASGENNDLELIDELRGLIEAGKLKLDKEDTEYIKELIKDAEEDDDDEKEEKKEKDDKKDAEEDQVPEEEPSEDASSEETEK